MPNLDHPDCAEDRAALEARLDSFGVDTVRHMLATAAFPTSSNVVVYEWLCRQSAPAAAGEEAAA